MAPAASKRSRPVAFNDDGLGNERTVTQSASSSFRNETQRKRARLSDNNAPRRARRSLDPDDDEPMVEQEVREPTPPPATQYEIIRDQGFKHLDYAEQDDQRATQRLKERPLIIGENHAALNAIIESITCINFMCHVKLHVELGPLLNFIVGENGSGKSAVLTAITLCLGGKASATNRGGSLKSFVKEGTEHASLVVKLKNQGEDAYMPDLYGDSIICERWFTKSGSSGFKVKSAAGRIISTKKADVDDIVEWYCLQVDNPLNVLSQDNARQFLNAASPALKYSYFIKGTQLEQLDEDYKVFTNYLEDQEAKLEELQENLAYNKEKFEKAVKLRDAASKVTEMRLRAKIYRDQMAWAQVEELEEVLAQRERDITERQEDINRTEEVIAEKARVLESIDDKIKQAEDTLEAEGEEEARAAEAVEKAKTRFSEVQETVEALHSSQRHMHTNLDSASKAVSKLEGEIAGEEQQLEARNGGAITRLQKELDAAEEELTKIKATTSEHEAGLRALQDAEKEAIKQLEGPKQTLAQKQEEIQLVEARLRTLGQARRDPLDAFDQRIRQLLKNIESDGGFAQKPIGPLGAYIQLTKAQWMPLIDKTIGAALSGFIVGSKADHARLVSHMDRLRINGSSIFIGGASLNNLKEPDAKFDTILRVLKFDSQLIRDHLIITNSIEQTLLIEDRVEAERVMFDGPPVNSGSCITIHDGRRNHGLRIINIRGHLDTKPIPFSPGQKPRMKTDQDEQVNYYKAQLSQLNAEYQEAEGLKRAGEQVVQRAKRATAQHVQRQVQLDNDREAIKRTISELNTEIDSYDGTDNRLQGLKESLKEEQERKDHYGRQFAEVAIKKDELSADAARLKEELEQAKTVVRDSKARVAKAKDKVVRFKETRRIALVEKNAAHEEHELAKSKKREAEALRDRQIQYVEEYRREATEIAPTRVQVPEGETYASIEAKFDAIRLQVQKVRSQMGASEEQINNRAAEATQEYRDAKASVKSVQMTVDLLKKSLVDRLAKFREFQRHVSAQARCNFSYLLSERGFRGQLLLDHRSRKLDVIVEPDKTRENGRGRNTKTLSGGEKSFSSICLLLAIWDAMGSPLRCLDEFDVFMDNVNRAISTNMLITAARRSVGKQFVLITPNAIEGRAQLDKDVKIIRLTDPRQQRLPDMMQ